MTNFQDFFAMSEHVCHFGTHKNDSFALSEHFPFRNNFFCHVGTFFHFGTQLFAISEHGLSRNGNHLNTTVVKGDRGKFPATVTIHPNPIITWFKNERKINPDPDLAYDFVNETGLYSLIIRHTDVDDAGEYAIHAKNPFGEDISKAYLRIDELHEKRQPTVRPVF